MEKLTWRSATAEDASLLFQIFAANKAAEFAPLGLAHEQLQPLLDMQFRARQMAYSSNFPNALDTILCLANGTPVGRQLIDRHADHYRCIDIAVLPEYQGRGIGAWALKQIQQLAQLEGVCFRLSVIQTNPAARLYERLGFTRISNDDVSNEMEWRPPTLRAARQAILPQDVPLSGGKTLPRAHVLDRILSFLRDIGLVVELGLVPQSSFPPGIQLIHNGLRVDLDALLYPGDLLHEAGHLATMTSEQRYAEFPVSTEPAEEMVAIAWSYAAVVHLGLPPEVVFHDHGYRGYGGAYAKGFAEGNCPGLPLLWVYGMTTCPQPGVPSIYPRMVHWLRPDPAESVTPAGSDQHADSELERETTNAHS